MLWRGRALPSKETVLVSPAPHNSAEHQNELQAEAESCELFDLIELQAEAESYEPSILQRIKALHGIVRICGIDAEHQNDYMQKRNHSLAWAHKSLKYELKLSHQQNMN